MPSNKPSDRKGTELENTEKQTLPAEINDLLGNVPEPERKQLTQVLIASQHMVSRVSPEMELSKKITPEHIDKMITMESDAMKQSFKELIVRCIVACFSGALLFGLVIFIVLNLKDKPDIMEKILYGGGGLIAGALGGYGFGKSQKDH